MFVQHQTVTAELRQSENALFCLSLGKIEFLEIEMTAEILSAPLIRPSAGMIHKPGGIEVANMALDVQRMELTPRLVERNPSRNARDVFQMIEHLIQLDLVLISSRLVSSAEKRMTMVIQIDVDHG
mgnify:CR=1 FL=1